MLKKKYLKKNFPRLINTSVKISVEQKNEIDSLNISFSQLIRDLLENWLQKNRPKKNTEEKYICTCGYNSEPGPWHNGQCPRHTPF